MLKKIIAAIAAIAIVGCLALAAPQAASAGTLEPADSTYQDDGGTWSSGGEYATAETTERLSTRVAADDAYAQQLADAVVQGDTSSLSTLLAAEGAALQAVDTEYVSELRIRVRVTVCVTYNGVRYCGTVIVTVEL